MGSRDKPWNDNASGLSVAGPSPIRTGLAPYALLTLTALCWAGNHVAGRASAGHVPPLAISTVRWVIPALLLLPFAWRHLRRDWPLIRAHRMALILLASIGGGVFSALQYVGVQYTTAVNASVLNSLSPVLIALSGALLFRDRLRPVQALGVTISLAGVLAIIARGDPAVLADFGFNWGDLVIVLNMAVFGVYSACLRLRPAIHWLSYMFIFALVSSLVTLPFAVNEYLSGAELKPDLPTAAMLAYAAIFPSLVANVAWNRGVELIGANRAGAMLHLIALFSAALASFFLGEKILPFHYIGFALILAGVWLAAKAPRSAITSRL